MPGTTDVGAGGAGKQGYVCRVYKKKRKSSRQPGRPKGSKDKGTRKKTHVGKAHRAKRGHGHHHRHSSRKPGRPRIHHC